MQDDFDRGSPDALEKPHLYGRALELETTLRVIFNVVCEADGTKDRYLELKDEYAGEGVGKYGMLCFYFWKSFEYPLREARDTGQLIRQDVQASEFIVDIYRRVARKMDLIDDDR